MKRFWNWLLRIFGPNPAKLVAVFRAEVHKNANPKETGIIFINCYEKKYGQRYFDARCTIPGSHTGDALIDNIKRLHGYERIEMWINGAFNPKIPSYAEMCDIEFASRVAGSESVVPQELGV